VSAGYYLRVVRSMFAGEAAADSAREPWPAQVAVIGTAVLVLALGIAAGPLFASL
jgi:NADH:ubiquinone oxidoreductase subunit 2 (subunit N)